MKRQGLGYAWYVVAALMLAYIFSYIDRTILSLLVAPIRSDMQISDTQLSLLHGFAFAVFYTLLGFPVGRLADRKNRVNIIAIGIGLWSLFTAACGLARNFWQLFLMRVGVGVGEAALNPCAYSIITDLFPKRLLSRALSTYVMGTYTGFGAAFIVGGLVVGLNENPTTVLPLIGEVRTWQAVFFYVGLPGLLVMALVWTTVAEPQRRGLVQADAAQKGVPIPIVLQFFKLNGWTLCSHVLGFGLLGILVNGLVLWTPSFFARTHGWDASEAGVLYGFVLLIFGPMGIFLGGWVADHLDKGNPRGGTFITSAGFVALAIIPAFVSPLLADPYLSLALIAVLVLCTSAPWGIAVSALQQFTPNEMRGQISAVYLFFVNIIGIGLGPTLIALITDYGFGDDLMLRYSMSIVAGTAGLLALLILVLGLPHFRASLQRLEALLPTNTEGDPTEGDPDREKKAARS